MEKKDTREKKIRIEKIVKLAALGIEAFPAKGFVSNTTTQAVKTMYGKDPTSCQDVKLAGRLITRRIMGAVSFAELQDHAGRIQLYVCSQTLCTNEDKTLYNQVFKKLLDVGDIIGIKGYAFTTKVGALAIHVTNMYLLTKAIRPLPPIKEVKTPHGDKRYYTLTNPEMRYRKRYVDILLNPSSRAIFTKRALIIQTMRKFFDQDGYLEVETPILQPIYGGAAARPFTTYHNTLDMPLYLRISNELYLKRLIVGGYPGVYEFAKDFRNEGMSRFHNPEFTMLEVYIAYRDYQWGMDYTEKLLQEVALALHGKTQVQFGEHVVDFKAPWARMTLYQAIKKFTNIDVMPMDHHELRDVATSLGITLDPNAAKAKVIDEIFSHACEPYIIQPTFITDYPVEMSPLAKQHRNNPSLVERFELFCCGKELCNAYSELNNPLQQRKRFEEQQALNKLGDKEAMVMDEDYLCALEYGMPPTVGIGIGIDRLTMIMANAASIQEVIFFPQMKQPK